jgi:hypothetical protein
MFSLAFSRVARVAVTNRRSVVLLPAVDFSLKLDNNTNSRFFHVTCR